MSTKGKKTFKQSVKTVNADDTFKVHPLARTPYQIYCEHFKSIKANLNYSLVSDKKPLFEVIDDDNTYLFFEDFEQINTLGFGDTISIRRVNLVKAEVERRAWWYLYQAFLKVEPIDPCLYDAIKCNLPKLVERHLFVGGFTIQNVIVHKNLKRYHFDYQRSKQVRHPHELPTFADLIQQVRHHS